MNRLVHVAKPLPQTIPVPKPLGGHNKKHHPTNSMYTYIYILYTCIYIYIYTYITVYICMYIYQHDYAYALYFLHTHIYIYAQVHLDTGTWYIYIYIYGTQIIPCTANTFTPSIQTQCPKPDQVVFVAVTLAGLQDKGREHLQKPWWLPPKKSKVPLKNRRLLYR